MKYSKEFMVDVSNALKPPLPLTPMEAKVKYNVSISSIYLWRNAELKKDGLLVGELWNNEKQLNAIKMTRLLSRSGTAEYGRKNDIHLEQLLLWNKNFESILGSLVNLDKENEIKLEES